MIRLIVDFYKLSQFKIGNGNTFLDLLSGYNPALDHRSPDFSHLKLSIINWNNNCIFTIPRCLPKNRFISITKTESSIH